jgi:purine-binding chemotaxis protein CheW
MTRFADVKIGEKLGIVFGSSVLVALCLAGLAVWSMISANEGAIAQRKRRAEEMTETKKLQGGQTALFATSHVSDALCALDSAGVQEVIRLGPVTPVRYAPEEVLGIVNLRGKIVTIVDLALRLGFAKAVAGSDSRIIVDDRNEFIGLLVYCVGEVVEVERDSWQPPPANVNWGQARFFKGVCRVRGHVITLLDAGQILAEG